MIGFMFVWSWQFLPNILIFAVQHWGNDGTFRLHLTERLATVTSGVTKEASGGQFPGLWITMWRQIIAWGVEWLRVGQNIPTLSQVLFSLRYICFRKISCSNIGATTCFLSWAPSKLITHLAVTDNYLLQLQTSRQLTLSTKRHIWHG